MAEYVVGKYAMLGLIRALESEYGSTKLRFHSLTPGMMDTKLLNNLPVLAIEASRMLRGGHLESVNSVAEKLVSLIDDPDGLLGDGIYLR
jgi:NAD(P)-dependent dehydrogenase (short-subunit alcohol dehydrogenase family)